MKRATPTEQPSATAETKAEEGDDGAIRDFDQLQEESLQDRTPRGVSIALVAVGCASIAFATMALGARRSAPPPARPDPLGELIAQRAKTPPNASAKPPGITVQDVTFPALLSDTQTPTTALAAVRSPGSAAVASTPASPLGAPPPPTDRLSVVPLPAQHVLHASPVVTRPRDRLTRAAAESAQAATASAPSASPGRDGGFQLQISSFRTSAEARDFAEQLRLRGHRSHVVEAHVPGRGTWYRVRVGPFQSHQAAAAYRASFEDKEHVVPFVVPPSK